MDRPSKLKFLLESYLKKIMSTHRFDMADFIGYMEPLFQRHGYRDEKNKSGEILVIRLDGITGAVLTSGFLRELKRNLPHARITLVVSSAAMPMAELCPYVDEIHSFGDGSATPLQDTLLASVSFCQQHLWKRYFDLCICPQWDTDETWSLLLGYLSGARERIGYSEKVHLKKAELNQGYDALLTRAIIEPSEYVHEVARTFYLLRAMNCDVADDMMEIWCSERDEYIAKRLLVNFSQKGPFAVVALGASQPCKKYPVEKYAAALKPLIKDGLGFVLLGGSRFALEGFYFYRLMPRGSVMNMIGQTSPRVTAAIIKRAALYIGNDTGLAHIAAALRIPVIEIQSEAVDLFGDPRVYSTYERYYPWKVPAIVLRPDHAIAPCDSVETLGGCSAVMPHCISQVSVKEIRAAYETLQAYLKEHNYGR